MCVNLANRQLLDSAQFRGLRHPIKLYLQKTNMKYIRILTNILALFSPNLLYSSPVEINLPFSIPHH